MGLISEAESNIYQFANTQEAAAFHTKFPEPLSCFPFPLSLGLLSAPSQAATCSFPSIFKAGVLGW